MAAGLPLFTDNHVKQQIVDGLRARGWDVVRAIDVFAEGTDDEVLFDYRSAMSSLAPDRAPRGRLPLAFALARVFARRIEDVFTPDDEPLPVFDQPAQ